MTAPFSNICLREDINIKQLTVINPENFHLSDINKQIPQVCLYIGPL